MCSEKVLGAQGLLLNDDKSLYSILINNINAINIYLLKKQIVNLSSYYYIPSTY
jgi:hypothetical protein